MDLKQTRLETQVKQSAKKKASFSNEGDSGVKDIALPLSLLFLGFVFGLGTWRSEERSSVSAFRKRFQHN